MKVELKVRRNFSDNKNAIHWTSCKPFIRNRNGELIHRPKHVVMYNRTIVRKNNTVFRDSYLIISHWCNSQVYGPIDIDFLDQPNDWEVVCKTCEANALKKGLPTSNELAGKRVRKGGVYDSRYRWFAIGEEA